MSLLGPSRFASRRCGRLRFVSSEAPEKPIPQVPHIPISTDFGGVQIRASPSPRNAQTSTQHHISRVVKINEFAEGTMSRRLAASKIQRERAQNVTFVEQVSHEQHERPQSQASDRDHQGSIEQRNRPDGGRKAWNRADVDRRRIRTNEDVMQTRRQFRPGSGSAPHWRRRRPSRGTEPEQEKGDAEDEDGIHYAEHSDSSFITVLPCVRPDVPLPKPRPTLPPPLRILETRSSGQNTKRMLEIQGGDYKRYFSPEEWERVRMQSLKSLGVLDRARLALSRNPTIGLKGKRAGIELVKSNMGKPVPT